MTDASSNVDRFLAAFQAIEGNLRDRAAEPDRDGHRSFPELLRAARGVLPRRIELDLRELSELRNALVHGTNGRVMAEPTDDAVAEIEHIGRLLVAPPLLLDVLGSGDVVTIDPDTSLWSAVRRMRADGFSQLPVYADGTFVGLLTADTVVRWMAGRPNGQELRLDTVSVTAVLVDVAAGACRFVPRTASVLDAVDAFEAARRGERGLVAIMISDGGRRDRPPLGIATVHDVPRLVDAVYPSPADRRTSAPQAR